MSEERRKGSVSFRIFILIPRFCGLLKDPANCIWTCRSLNSNRGRCTLSGPARFINYTATGIPAGYVLSLSKKLLENTANEIEPASINEFVSSLMEHKHIHIDPHYRADMQDILERMMRETASVRDYSNEILCRYFNIFLFYLRKQLTDSSINIIQNRNIQVAQQFKTLVDKHYKTKKLVSDYASELNITPNYLNEIIKKVTGHSAGYLIRQRIAMEAKRYAVHSTCLHEGNRIPSWFFGHGAF